jgi:DNA-binding SARP family transcriptional activator
MSAAEPMRAPGRGCVCALGRLTVTPAGEPAANGSAGLGRYPSRLLAALVAVGPEGTSRGRLIQMVWGAPMETRTLGRLRTTLSRLRTALAAQVGADDVIVDAPPSRLRLNDVRVRVDAWHLLERAGNPGRDLDGIVALLSDVRGPFAAGQGGAAWIDAYRICCREAHQALTEHAVAALAARGHAEEAERLALRARTAALPAGPGRGPGAR